MKKIIAMLLIILLIPVCASAVTVSEFVEAYKSAIRKMIGD